MQLHELLDQVTDRESFYIFVQALIDDRIDEVAKEKLTPSSPYSPGANGWQNGTIENFLNAALSGSKGGHLLSSEAPSWRGFAEFLYLGKIYE